MARRVPAFLVALVVAASADALVHAFNVLATEESFFPGSIVIGTVVGAVALAVALELFFRGRAAVAWACGGIAAGALVVVALLLWQGSSLDDAEGAAFILALVLLPLSGYVLLAAILGASHAGRVAVGLATAAAVLGSVVAVATPLGLPRVPVAAAGIAARALQVGALALAIRSGARLPDRTVRHAGGLWLAGLLLVASSWAVGGVAILIPVAWIAGVLLFLPALRWNAPWRAGALVILFVVGWAIVVPCSLPSQTDTPPPDGSVPAPFPVRERLLEVALHGPRWDSNLGLFGPSGPHCATRYDVLGGAYLLVVLGVGAWDGSLRRRGARDADMAAADTGR